MGDELINGAEAVSLFCRLNINTKKDLPVRSSEMGLLILICRSDKRVTPVMAADYFKVKKPMITTMISNLTKLGYVEKVPSPDDQRSFFIAPTERTRQLVDDTFSEYIKSLDMLRQKLGADDFGHLMTLLEKANSILVEEKTNG